MCRPLANSVYQKIFFLFLNQNICCAWVLKRTVLIEHPEHMLKLIDKEIFTILHSKICLSKPVYVAKKPPLYVAKML